MEEDRVFELLSRITATLGAFLGRNVEVVLHDLRQLEQSIVAVGGTPLTNRKVGDTIDGLGIRFFEQQQYQDAWCYETKTKSGKTLRSCTIFVRDENGDAIGALCINQDQTAMLKLRGWLDDMLEPSKTEFVPVLEQNIEDVLNQLIQDAIRSTGKTVEELTREDKVAVISYLDLRGAFQIRYSMEKVASLLAISRYSIYNYMDQKTADPEAAAETR